MSVKPNINVPLMRAKLQVSGIIQAKDTSGRTVAETLSLTAVCGDQPFGPEGESEDNSFARWTPTASLGMAITNPNLFGMFSVGQKFYVDFTEAS